MGGYNVQRCEGCSQPMGASHSVGCDFYSAAEQDNFVRASACVDHWVEATVTTAATPDTKPGTKFDSGKLMYRLIDPHALAWLAGVLTFGAAKYAPDNWRRVDGPKYVDALQRHFELWRSGEENDEETGFPHLAHVLCNAMFLCWLHAPRDMKEVVRRTQQAIARWKEQQK